MPPPAAKRSARGRALASVALLAVLVAAAAPAHAEPLLEVTACPAPASAPAGPASPGEPVGCVASFSVTESSFDHWMQVATDATLGGSGKKPVPVPPRYAACVARLAKRAHGRPKPTPAELRARCEREYRALRSQTLGFLLSSAWLLNEAKALKVEVSGAEALQRFIKTRNQAFPKAGEFSAFLRSSGETVSDLIFRVKLNLISERLQAQVLAGASTPQAKSKALAQFVKDFRTKWQSQTYCRAGFVVSDCGHVVASL